mmetsp:Transcript_43916/g.69790  ORF Transcript_43916/g.69790 Transcript_43916/m.69790 type:complete len:206 (+) Transcript_43916:631-1248(+)
MTFPSCPVTAKLGGTAGTAAGRSASPALRRGSAVASMYSTEPPMAVQAKPVTVPEGKLPSYSRSDVKTGFPTYSVKAASSTRNSIGEGSAVSFSDASPSVVVRPSHFSTTLVAILRQMRSMCFWRFRTPASLQYQRINDSMALASMTALTSGFLGISGIASPTSEAASEELSAELSSGFGGVASFSFVLSSFCFNPTSTMALGTK